MSRIHPSSSAHRSKGGDVDEVLPRPREDGGGGGTKAAAWTVWKKSSMAFQGTDGFCVYDCDGRLAFRVDNYSRKSKLFAGDIVLMDGSGEALFTLRPQILSMRDRWEGFEGEFVTGANPTDHPLFTMRRRSRFQKGDEAEVFMAAPGEQFLAPDFRVDGCFAKRCCTIWSGDGEVAAEITRKRSGKAVVLGDDVFSLVVKPGFQTELIMAFVVVMDRICQRPRTPFMCS